MTTFEKMLMARSSDLAMLPPVAKPVFELRNYREGVMTYRISWT